jgi:hypothetical protein
MAPKAAQRNERILSKVEDYGGGYVWEREIFAVILMDVAITDAEAVILTGLTGVQQIVLNASRLSVPTLQKIASIAGLGSLVLSGITLTPAQQLLLQRCGPKVEVVADEA